ncbi:hypothetical protein ABFV83_20170 [Lacrimispora sp. BS-2]|uniref:Uncharacterized protein n=1 Tax=Lacrimispora sp. BS-2 TaxID=3151850 RepID=A0AAU7PP91_9FIRM
MEEFNNKSDFNVYVKRKDPVQWVDYLKKSVQTGVPFPLDKKP